MGHSKASTVLPKSSMGLLAMAASELAIFAIIFGLACFASRATADQLLLKWRGGVKPVLWGMLYSVGLRIGVLIVMIPIVITVLGLKGNKPESMSALRPQIENMLDVDVLVHDQVYLVLTLTLVSFVVAGLREELWRSGMLAALTALFPRQFKWPWGQMGAVAIVAIFFGLGHVAQGPGGILLTTILGLGLGTIMVWHKSVWEAVLAHGFFDASTFFMLYLLVKYMPQALNLK